MSPGAGAAPGTSRPRQGVSALEGIGDGFVIFDADWRYAYVNRRAEQLLGVGCQEILGQNVWERYPDT
ncbi:PAS domain-containing protein [Azonexus sp.]|uniref:PAS domain-containing protein n=1 Tax=Azonexus sp. TaxID=1872668 RepID=UPI0035B41B0F